MDRELGLHEEVGGRALPRFALAEYTGVEAVDVERAVADAAAAVPAQLASSCWVASRLGLGLNVRSWPAFCPSR